jgi:hypothetical protein
MGLPREIPMVDYTPAFGILDSLNLPGTLPTDGFVEAVRTAWEEQFPCIENLITTPSSDWGGTCDNLDEFNLAQASLMDRIRQLPRGTWGTIIQRMPAGDVFTDAIISAGGGSISMHCFTHDPTFAEVVAKLVYDEIYAARQQFRAYVRSREMSAALAANNWRVGTVLRDVAIDGSHYGSLEITEIFSDGIVVEAITRSGREKHTYKLQPRDIEILDTKAAA